MTDEEKARVLRSLAEAAGIPVKPEYVPGIIGNFGNFEALHRRVLDGFSDELPLDPLGTYQP